MTSTARSSAPASSPASSGRPPGGLARRRRSCPTRARVRLVRGRRQRRRGRGLADGRHPPGSRAPYARSAVPCASDLDPSARPRRRVESDRAGVVAYEGPTPGFVFSRFRRRRRDGRGRGDAQRSRTRSTRCSRVRRRWRTLGSPTSASSTTRSAQHRRQALGPTDRRSTTTACHRTPQYGWRRVQPSCAPERVVAAWSRWPTLSNQTMEIVVGRLNGATWDLKVFKLAGAVSSPRLAVRGR